MEKLPQYTTISIPVELAEKIDAALEKGGYNNRPDFVRDAIRRLLKELEHVDLASAELCEAADAYRKLETKKEAEQS